MTKHLGRDLLRAQILAFCGALVAFAIITVSLDTFVRPKPGIYLTVPVTADVSRLADQGKAVLALLKRQELTGTRVAAIVGRVLEEWCRAGKEKCDERVDLAAINRPVEQRQWKGRRLHDGWVYLFVNETDEPLRMKFVYLPQPFDWRFRNAHWLRRFLPSAMKVLDVGVEPGRALIFQPTLSGQYDVRFSAVRQGSS